MQSSSAIAAEAIGPLIDQFSPLIHKGIDELDRKVDEERSVPERVAFTRSFVDVVESLNLNVVIISTRHTCKGHVNWIVKEVGEREYYVYFRPKNFTWALKNLGDGGWENWSLKETNWVRRGKIVKFHGHWESSYMGEPYEVRNQAEFPGWDDIEGSYAYVAPRRV